MGSHLLGDGSWTLNAEIIPDLSISRAREGGRETEEPLRLEIANITEMSALVLINTGAEKITLSGGFKAERTQ